MSDTPDNDPLEPEELMGKDLVTQRLRLGVDDIAEMGTTVVCNLRGYFYSTQEKRRISSEPFEEIRNQQFQIGESDVIPGLELALRHSRKGEVIKVTIASKFGYGPLGRCYAVSADGSASTELEQMPVPSKSGPVPIPPNSDLEYEVEVTDHLPDGYLSPSLISKMEKELSLIESDDDEEKRHRIIHRYQTLQSMTARKEAGNRWFSYLDYPRAARAYSKATQLAQSYFNPETGKKQSVGETLEETAKKIEQQEREKDRPVNEDDKDLVEVYVACLNNLAACKLSMKEFGAAKDLCVQVLQFSPFNTKALLRAAKAALAQDEYEESEACLKRILSIPTLEENTRSAAKLEQQRLKKAVADYKARSKVIQKNIAAKLFAKQQEGNNRTTELHDSSSAAAIAGTLHEMHESAHLPAKEMPVKAVQKSTTTVSDAAPTTSNTSTVKEPTTNVAILMATSLAVIIISVVCAYWYSQ